MSPKNVEPGLKAVEQKAPQTPLRRPYTKPAIIHELRLETHAGTLPPFGRNPLDPFNIRKG